VGHYSSFTCICTVRTIRSKAAFATLSSVVHCIVQFGRCPSNLMNVVRSYPPPARDRDASSVGWSCVSDHTRVSIHVGAP
jgi:hypothetical protein